jgi:hypothetical protein
MMKTSATAAGLAFLLCLMTTVNNAHGETIPLLQNHGVYTLPVRINDTITLPFVIDSGASEVAIPSDVFLTLTRSGSMRPGDALGTGTYQLADGSTLKSERFLLHEVRVGDKIIKDVIANVAPVSGDPLLGQSFLSRLPLWTLDNSRHMLILGDETIETDRAKPGINGYQLTVQDGWLLSSAKLFSQTGQLIMRRYGYELSRGSFSNVLLFFCPRQSTSFSALDIVIPKNYGVKSFDRFSKNPKLGVRILTDNTSTWHFEADYKNGEMFIDRTPVNYTGFDAVMNARELLIGFGIGDSLHYYLTPKMDAFMKEASAALGSGTAELADITFLDRMGANSLCHEFQAGRFHPQTGAQATSTGRFWVLRGTVSCPDCDPSKGKTSVDLNISKQNEERTCIQKMNVKQF